MKKHIIAIVGLIVALIMVFTACTAKNGAESANGTTAPSETVSTVLTEENTSEVTTESTTETTTEPSTEETSKAQTTEKKTESKQTTPKKDQSPQKQTPTKPKVTTTKKVTTTQKKISAKDVQQQVNNYIKSKGVKVDSSRTPSNASYRYEISALQKHLNDGSSLRNCKECVDYLIKESKDETGNLPSCMYCYYSNDTFYVLYMPA